MKKILAVLSFALMTFALQANAAPLAWDSVPSPGVAGVINQGLGDSTNALLGISIIGNANSNINHTWKFEVLNSATPVKVEVTDIPDGWLSTATFLFAGHNLLSSAWTGTLLAGVYDINIAGITVLGNQSYSLRVDVNEVPVPAAVWLFGSALVGLMGAKRRKTA